MGSSLKPIIAFVLTLSSSIFILSIDKVDAKINTSGRTEYYAKSNKVSNAERATSDEYLALGAECTATVNIKENKGKSNFRSFVEKVITNAGEFFWEDFSSPKY